MIIKIFDELNNESATLPQQGDQIYKLIYTELKKDFETNENYTEELIFNFSKIDDLTTAFLNNCLGKLFYDFPYEYLMDNIKFENLTNNSQVKSIRLTLSNALMNIKKNN